VNLVSLDGVARRHADTQVLDDVTLGIDEGDRVGVIGRNASGKSTLLRLIAGADEPDSGRIVTGAGARIGYVPQEPAFDPTQRVLAAVLDVGGGAASATASAALRAAAAFAAAAAALEVAPSDPGAQARLEAATRTMDAEGGWDAERHARALLDRLAVGDVGQRLGALSGGQRKRVALARGLAAEAELLILDEPTNHLDIDAVEWLEGELASRRGALVLVTHDRYLLDRLATRIVEVEGGALHSGSGSYADYLETRVRRDELAAATERRRQNRARTELAWLRRGARARTSKARYRVERAQELITPRPGEPGGEVPAAHVDVALPSRRLGSKVVNLYNAGKRYGERWVLRGVEQRLSRDARVGVVGPNGAGKTTLLALIAGRLEPDEGKVAIGDTVVPGWYGQDPAALPATQRVIDAVKDVVLEATLPDGGKVGAGALLERFGFPPSAQRGRVGELSGGERRRLELLRVLATTPNLLLLDEPTNDLDLDTLAILEEFLDGWTGALVVASHDRYFLDRVCDDLFSIEPDGNVRHHPGGWSAWRAEQGARHAGAGRGLSREQPQPQPQPDAPDRPRRLGYAQRRELTALERQLTDLEDRRRVLELSVQRAGDDYQAALAAGEELAAVLASLDVAESRWLELAAQAEAAVGPPDGRGQR